jgi:molecular chaperone GrpE
MSDKGVRERDEPGSGNGEGDDYRVEDRRHWQRDEDASDAGASEPAPQRPTILDEYRQRAEDAERRLQEYIAAFKRHQDEQEQVRERLARDVERRVDLRFGEMVADLLGVSDDLDLALAHAAGNAGAEPLAAGVAIARDRFLATLERQGVQRFAPDRLPFDPNEAEALRVDAVADPALDGVVTETLRPGYRYGERVIRPARVAVGRSARTADRT